MEEKALEILNLFNEAGYEAYIVGGYVRDYLLNRKTNDIDICTSATPKEILSLFDSVIVSDTQYGSVVIAYKGYKFDVTTFRKEIKYESNRRPVKIKYIRDIKKDLLRRDFTINTLCMNRKKEVLDILNIKEDLDNRILRTVGNPRYRIKEDSLRILRCIRFATLLDFEVEPKTKHFLSKYGYLLKDLSGSRKKEELDKIFSSKNNIKGKNLLIELNLTNVLNINKLNSITLCTDLIGIWCQLEVDDIFPFTRVEKEQMQLLRKLLTYDKLDNYLLYKYGLYLCTVYADIKGLSKRKLNTEYQNLKIQSRKDIDFSGRDIASSLKLKPGKYIRDIMDDIEKKILEGKLNNSQKDIESYVIKTYKNTKLL